jgi:hypothetical protein
VVAEKDCIVIVRFFSAHLRQDRIKQNPATGKKRQ